MEKHLQSGRDILYLGFSSALSSTYEAGAMAAAELAPKYPDRKIYTVDTLCASLGQGLLVYLTAQERKRGCTIEEARDFAERTKAAHLPLVHGGRPVPPKARRARVRGGGGRGSMLGIKPVMHVDNGGRLINVEKVRGRRRSIERLAEKAEELGTELAGQTVFISHGDCIDDVRYLEERLHALGVKETLVNFVGPVIGAHSGPGTLAMFFVGRER